MLRRLPLLLLGCILSAAALAASAADVGRIKLTAGDVFVEREGQRIAAAVDAGVRASDTVVTGPNGSVGITFIDNSRVSAGPNSTLVLNRYAFDQTTHAGAFDATLRRGTLAVVSGRMARQSPESVTVRTPTMVLGVRGTEFLVYAE
jgi:hypothetical protein